jgi:hypothetical protein
MLITQQKPKHYYGQLNIVVINGQGNNYHSHTMLMEEEDV